MYRWRGASWQDKAVFSRRWKMNWCGVRSKFKNSRSAHFRFSSSFSIFLSLLHRQLTSTSEEAKHQTPFSIDDDCCPWERLKKREKEGEKRKGMENKRDANRWESPFKLFEREKPPNSKTTAICALRRGNTVDYSDYSKLSTNFRNVREVEGQRKVFFFKIAKAMMKPAWIMWIDEWFVKYETTTRSF